MEPETSNGLVCDLLSGSYSVHTPHSHSLVNTLRLMYAGYAAGAKVRSNVERIRLLVDTRRSHESRFVNPSVSSEVGRRVENAPIRDHPQHKRASPRQSKNACVIEAPNPRNPAPLTMHIALSYAH
jgi:hypothetical protein